MLSHKIKKKHVYGSHWFFLESWRFKRAGEGKSDTQNEIRNASIRKKNFPPRLQFSLLFPALWTLSLTWASTVNDVTMAKNVSIIIPSLFFLNSKLKAELSIQQQNYSLPFLLENKNKRGKGKLNILLKALQNVKDMRVRLVDETDGLY